MRFISLLVFCVVVNGLSVDLRLTENKNAHHTNLYRNDDWFVIRRGQAFNIGVTCPGAPAATTAATPAATTAATPAATSNTPAPQTGNCRDNAGCKKGEFCKLPNGWYNFPVKPLGVCTVAPKDRCNDDWDCDESSTCKHACRACADRQLCCYKQCEVAAGEEKRDTEQTNFAIELNPVSTDGNRIGNSISLQASGGSVISVKTPANTRVGLYTMSITGCGQTVTTKPVFILFNPWVSEDEVYVPNEDDRNEYVLAETGLIWTGGNPGSPKPWTFGQFNGSPLKAAAKLLDGLQYNSRNAVSISRYWSQKLNSNSDGILEGRWDNQYGDGKSPTDWSNSVDIINQWLADGTGVKYGQCWVFSGLYTTMGRTLGIPTRSVTNFDSAHEYAPQKKRVELFYDANGSPQKQFNTGSVWNFHVWNEIFTTRTDVANSNGWQAVDATPQELSEGKYQMGPAALTLVKAGDMRSKYDTGFVGSETNADVAYYIQRETGGAAHPTKRGYYLYSLDTTKVGKNISTKKVGSNQVNILNDLYKPSQKKRDIINGKMKSPQYLEVHLKRTKGKVGHRIHFELVVKNHHSKKVYFDFWFRLYAAQYTGANIKQIYSKKDKVYSVKAHSTFRKHISIHKKWYQKFLKITNTLRALVLVTLPYGKKDFNSVYIKDTLVTIHRPTIKVAVPKSIVLNRDNKFWVVFKNPLKKSLKHLTLTCETPSVTATYKIKGKIPAKHTGIITGHFRFVDFLQKYNFACTLHTGKRFGSIAGFTRITRSHLNLVFGLDDKESEQFFSIPPPVIKHIRHDAKLKTTPFQA